MGSKIAMPTLKRFFLGCLIASSVGVVLALAALIPFSYPTQTLWYKTGVAKSLLLAGHVAGLSALVLFFCQLILGVRPKILEQVFGIGLLMRIHRVNGYLVLFFALSHVGLVILPEGLTNLPIGWKYWPELLGAGLLCCLIITITISKYRAKLHLGYRFWRWLHRLMAIAMFVLAVAHVMFVSDAFAGGLLRGALLVIAIMVIAIVVVVKRGHRTRGK